MSLCNQENKGKNKPMEAYIIMLHLVFTKKAKFTDIRDLLLWDQWKQSEAIRIIAYINQRIIKLSNEWDEEIPRINAFMLNRHGKHTSYVCREIFNLPDDGTQPTPEQSNAYAESIENYTKWDLVLEVFRKEAMGN